MVGPALGAAAGPGGWFVGRPAVLLVCWEFQRRRQHLATTTAHIALPVFGQPALGMLWATARSDSASAVWSRHWGACTRGCGRAGHVVYGGCGFAGLWRSLKEEASLGNHSAQSPASVWVASPGHAKEHCKVNCSLCCVQQVWLSRHWGLRQGRGGGLWGLRFCRFREISKGGGSTRQPQRTEPCQCVSDQPWACYGALQERKEEVFYFWLADIVFLGQYPPIRKKKKQQLLLLRWATSPSSLTPHNDFVPPECIKINLLWWW